MTTLTNIEIYNLAKSKGYTIKTTWNNTLCSWVSPEGKLVGKNFTITDSEYFKGEAIRDIIEDPTKKFFATKEYLGID